MSIVRTCVRVAAVEAIRDHLWKGTRVFDSNNSPLDDTVREKDTPFVSVFTDTDERTVSGRDVFAAPQKLQIVIEFGLGGAIPAGETVEVGVPATDSGFERALDAIERHVLLALVHNPKSAWGEIWRNMVNEISSAKSDRGGEAERGGRWAARALTIVCDCVADPPVGRPVDSDHPVAAFIAAAKAAADDGLKTVAAFVESQIMSTALPDWRIAQGQLGLAEAEVRGIGIAPPYGAPDDEVDLAAIGLHPTGPLFDEDAAEAVVNPQELPEPASPAPVPQEPPPNEV